MNIDKVRTYYYHHLLNEIDEGENELLLDFIKKRKISTGMIHHFKYGYSPDTWNTKYLFDIYDEEFLLETGLISISENNKKQYPFFRGRFMFPTNNYKGECVAFSARDIQKDSKWKFLNSKDSSLYSKESILYGQDTKELITSGYAIIVEGNLDCDRMQAIGFKNTVAPCGTSLTFKQIILLKRIVDDNFVLIFDGDKAGIEASIRATKAFKKLNLKNPKVVFMPEGSDPDSYILENEDFAYQKISNLIDGSKIIKIPKEKQIELPDNYKYDDSEFDLLTEVSKHVQLKQHRDEFVGCCPFHEEKTPSFKVNPSKNAFKCFGCGEGGKGAELFVMKLFKIDYKQAVDKLNRGF